jgi:hypothetical protein
MTEKCATSNGKIVIPTWLGKWILGAILTIALAIFGLWRAGMETRVKENTKAITEIENTTSNRLTRVETQLEFIITKQWGSKEFERFERSRPQRSHGQGD